MQIIVVPEGNRKGIPTSLSNRHLAIVAIVGLLVLPALVGALTYKLSELYYRQNGSPALSAYHKELKHSRAALRKTREEAARHLNALALKLGTLQAQVLRLNALGSRLTRMAGLDGREFNFDALPAMGGPEKSSGDTAPVSDITHNLSMLAHELDRSQARLMALENLMIDRHLDAAVTPTGWPVRGGWISSGFGKRTDPFSGERAIHEGVDIAASLGGPVLSMGEGVVSFAGEKPNYGTVVEITHEAGLVTRYGHLSELLVKQGEKVSRGQQVGKVGSTGRSTGPHLHFEVVRNQRPIDPSAYLSSPSWPVRTADVSSTAP